MLLHTARSSFPTRPLQQTLQRLRPSLIDPDSSDLFPELTQIFARHRAIVLRGSRPLPKQVRVTRNDTVVTVYLYERLRLPRSRLVHINIVPTARTQHSNYCASVALFAFDLLGLQVHA